MIPLNTQTEYEDLWFGRAPPSAYGPSGTFLIWFTAKWCGPCQRMDRERLEKTAADAQIPFYVCDETVNKYTPGYCDVRAFPTFMLLRPGQVIGSIRNSNTADVCKWILGFSKVSECEARGY